MEAVLNELVSVEDLKVIRSGPEERRRAELERAVLNES